MDTKNKNAIFFAISDSYAFAVANILMSLQRYSPQLMSTVDVIIYHNGISEKNAELLCSFHSDIYLLRMEFPKEWEEILIHPRVLRWGEYVVCKFFGFELIGRYEKVLHLDADMHVRGDISELFQLEEEFAWRSIIGWDTDKIFSDILPEGGKIKCGNGGLLMFTDRLLKYNIDAAEIKSAFDEIKNLRDGGIDELVTAWLVHKKGISLRELDISVYNTPVAYDRTESVLVHFLNYYSVSGKPWKNPAAFMYYGDWAENYRRWTEAGGEEAVSFSEKDYYGLFGYERVNELKRLKDDLAVALAQRKEALGELERKNAEAHSLREENRRLSNEIRRAEQQNLCLESTLGAIIGSRSWKITRPLRALADFFRRCGRR